MKQTFTPQQVYKTRAEAFRLFCLPQKLPVSQAKFYQDAERLRMVRPDKSIHLADLLGYVKEELKVDPVTGQSLGDRDLTAKKELLAIKEQELKIARMEREAHKDDRDWIHREKVNEREGALVGQIMEEAKYQLTRAVPEVIILCKGDITREIEVAQHIVKALYSAFRTLYESAEIDMVFGEDEE